MNVDIIEKADGEGFWFILSEDTRGTLIKKGLNTFSAAKVYISFETKMEFENLFGKTLLRSQIPVLLTGLSRSRLGKINYSKIRYVSPAGSILTEIGCAK